jgi:CRP-like cAMP-binding protein
MNSTTENKVGTGKGMRRRHEKTFPRGSLMFIEGEYGTDMYIVKSGKVRILKQEGGNTIELAVLGPGSVLGELSLLDHQPRSATGQVVEEAVVTVIDEALLKSTLEKIPSWLSSVVHLIVKRLRDTMKRTSDDIVQKSVAGLLRILLLCAADEPQTKKGYSVVSLQKLKEAVYAVIGLSDIETEKVLLHCILKEMIYIRKAGIGTEYIFIRNTDALELYMNYLRKHEYGGTLPEENISAESIDLMRTICTVGEREQDKESENIYRVPIPLLERELKESDKAQYVDLDTLDELVHAQLVITHNRTPSTSKYGQYRNMIIKYNKTTIQRVELLHQWIPMFREKIQF